MMPTGIWKPLRKRLFQWMRINAYNHMAIYLRWCMEHDLMDKKFLVEYGEVVEKVKADPDSVGLREFIRDELDGQLVGPLFNKIGRAFASYYYGEPDSPYFPSDIDNYAISVIGQERNYSEEIQDEAYLFIPFDEDYYQAMAEVIGERFEKLERTELLMRIPWSLPRWPRLLWNIWTANVLIFPLWQMMTPLWLRIATLSGTVSMMALFLSYSSG